MRRARWSTTGSGSPRRIRSPPRSSSPRSPICLSRCRPTTVSRSAFLGWSGLGRSFPPRTSSRRKVREASPTKELVKAWADFDLQHALGVALGKPARVANDADLQGSAVVKGDGLEVVLTLGTGFGSAIFYEGKLMPHIELAHHPFLKGEEYNDGHRRRGPPQGRQEGVEQAGGRGHRHRAGPDLFRPLLHRRAATRTKVTFELPTDVTLVDNTAGILGGIKLWERTD